MCDECRVTATRQLKGSKKRMLEGAFSKIISLPHENEWLFVGS